MLSTSTKRSIRLISAIILGIIIPFGFSLIFFDLGIISYLAPIPSGLVLGLLLVSRKSLENDAISGMLTGILIGSICIFFYVIAFQHEVAFPKIELLAVAIIFGLGPLISIGVERLRKKHRAA